jgi:hypothetical protein
LIVLRFSPPFVVVNGVFHRRLGVREACAGLLTVPNFSSTQSTVTGGEI